MGMVMFAGVDYLDVLRQAEREADVVVWAAATMTSRSLCLTC